jgi:hypothetical protein
MRLPCALASRSAASTAPGTRSGASVGSTTMVPAVRSAVSPHGTWIWKPASTVTAGVTPQTDSRYQGTPSPSVLPGPKMSQATPSSNRATRS